MAETASTFAGNWNRILQKFRNDQPFRITSLLKWPSFLEWLQWWSDWCKCTAPLQLGADKWTEF